jgi:hypothetical protein
MDDHHFGSKQKFSKKFKTLLRRCVVGKFAAAKEIDEKQIGGANHGFFLKRMFICSQSGDHP